MNTTSTLSYADLHKGIPSLISCIEMVPISMFLIWAYPVRPYLLETRSTENVEMHAGEYYPTSYQGGPLGIWAFLVMLNPRDTLEAIWIGIRDRRGEYNYPVDR